MSVPDVLAISTVDRVAHIENIKMYLQNMINNPEEAVVNANNAWGDVMSLAKQVEEVENVLRIVHAKQEATQAQRDEAQKLYERALRDFEQLKTAVVMVDKNHPLVDDLARDIHSDEMAVSTLKELDHLEDVLGWDRYLVEDLYTLLHTPYLEAEDYELDPADLEEFQYRLKALVQRATKRDTVDA